VQIVNITSVNWQDFVANPDVADTSAGVYEMTSNPTGVPVNGACPSSRSGRPRRHTSVASPSQIVANSTSSAAETPAGFSSGGQSSTPGGGEGLGALIGGSGGGVSTATEQRLSRLLDKISETIELNELRLLMQDHKDAVKLEWQQVTKIIIVVVVITATTYLVTVYADNLIFIS